MFQSTLVLLSIVLILYIAHLCLKAYTNKTLNWESFQSKVTTKVAAPQLAPPTFQAPPEPPRVVAPSGPNPPNATAPSGKVPPEITTASDPYQETNSETPIRDNLRHPENSFSPGVENTGTQISTGAGISSNTVQAGVSQFSPEFAQNGGDFMTGVVASDSFSGGDNYATI